MERWKRLVLAGCLCLGAGTLAVHAAGPAVELSGTWRLNKELSDKPPAMEAGGDREGGGDRTGGRTGGRGRGGAGGGMPGGTGGMMPGGRRPDPAEMRRIRDQVSAAAEPDERLVIVQGPEGVSITTGDGRFTKLIPDGKAHESLTGDGVLKTKTRWDEEKLVSEGKLDDGIAVTRTYAVDATTNPRRLVLLVRIAAPRMPGAHDLKRVYDLEQ